MDFALIRKSIDVVKGFKPVSQDEMAVLLGIPVSSIRNWEQSTREPEAAALNLYELICLKNVEVIKAFVTLACMRTYSKLKESQALLRLLLKLFPEEPEYRAYRDLFLKNNPNFTLKKSLQILQESL